MTTITITKQSNSKNNNNNNYNKYFSWTVKTRENFNIRFLIDGFKSSMSFKMLKYAKLQNIN
jgi:hypothetical protein